MRKLIGFDYSKALQFVSEKEIEYMERHAKLSLDMVLNKNAQGNDF